MSKKKQNKKSTTFQFNDSLPQNIVSLGENVEENKHIYILQSVYKEIHRFTNDKTTNESGGILFGNVVEQFGKTNIIILGFVEAKYCEGTPTTLKFTHETWDYIHKESNKKFKDLKMLGWIHTHPNFGIFLSEYDKFIQENFFNEENQIAYVIDPIQNIEGFYFWINNKIERCKGFFVFDKTGVKIELKTIKKDNNEQKGKTSNSSVIKNIIIILLVAITFILSIAVVSLSNKVLNLQKQQQSLADLANQNFAIIQQQLNELENQYDSKEEDKTNYPDEKDNENKKTIDTTSQKKEINNSGLPNSTETHARTSETTTKNE